ncbi:hypothetical protein Taro_024117, partial [Colocasia esculenta]|nr:hypothetical protein [Colocasia esculenta]
MCLFLRDKHFFQGKCRHTSFWCRHNTPSPKPKMKKWSSSVDTRPSQVDTRGRSQRTMFTGLYNQVDTRCSQGVDTGSSQVDTRDLSQRIVLPVWDSVSTHPMGRSTHSGNFMT